MLAVIIGIMFVILAVVLWLAGISVAHALAILIGLVGILIILYGVVPAATWRRGV